MDWGITVSESERHAATLTQDNTRRVYGALHAHGVALLRGAFTRSAIASLHSEFEGRYGAVDAGKMAALASRPPPNPILQVGPLRFDIVLKMTGPFAAPGIFASPLLMRLLLPVLTAGMRLGGFTVVVSYPGAGEQQIHRDHSSLFGQPGVAPNLPIYALNIAVPLIDVDLDTGPTAIWPGSHRWPEQTRPQPGTQSLVAFERGDCILIDYRTLHAGVANRSAQKRPILYMPYMRTWFTDDVNYLVRAPLDMPLEIYEALDEPARALLKRAYSETMRARHLGEAHQPLE